MIISSCLFQFSLCIKKYIIFFGCSHQLFTKSPWKSSGSNSAYLLVSVQSLLKKNTSSFLMYSSSFFKEFSEKPIKAIICLLAFIQSLLKKNISYFLVVIFKFCQKFFGKTNGGDSMYLLVSIQSLVLKNLSTFLVFKSSVFLFFQKVFGKTTGDVSIYLFVSLQTSKFCS